MCHGLTILVTPLVVTSAVPLKPTLLQCIFAPKLLFCCIVI